jgi:hypothetical protein
VAGFYWAAAVPVVLGATWLTERRLEHRRSIQVDGWPFWATGLAMLVANACAAVVLAAELLGFLFAAALGGHSVGIRGESPRS